MGHIRHRAILVTAYDGKFAAVAWRKARKIFCTPPPNLPACPHEYCDAEVFEALVSPVIQSVVNGYFTFCIMPDGSKMGWLDANWAEELRDKFINYITDRRGYTWAEVQYGDDAGDNNLLRCS